MTSLETMARVVAEECRMELILAAEALEATPAPWALSDLGQNGWHIGMADAAKILRKRASEIEPVEPRPIKHAMTEGAEEVARAVHATVRMHATRPSPTAAKGLRRGGGAK